MSCIFIAGIGAVSPAGWGLGPFREALARGAPIPTNPVARPGWETPLRARTVPAPPSPLTQLAQPRLRRVSPVTRYAVAAGLEALGEAGSATQSAPSSTSGARLGLILCVMSGCVNYSHRFYGEALQDPATASPLLFPETVFNAPASHLAALLGTTGLNYTLVGDSGVFLQGMALAAQWLATGQVDACAVVGAEEMDWTTGDSFGMFARGVVVAEGAGAVCLRRKNASPSGIQLERVSSSHLFLRTQSRAAAARMMRAELAPHRDNELLCDGLQGVTKIDAAEQSAWRDWRGPRLSPKKVLGEALTAGAAWQCVAAIDALRRGEASAASLSVVGCNQEAIGARLVRTNGSQPCEPC